MEMRLKHPLGHRDWKEPIKKIRVATLWPHNCPLHSAHYCVPHWEVSLGLQFLQWNKESPRWTSSSSRIVISSWKAHLGLASGGSGRGIWRIIPLEIGILAYEPEQPQGKNLCKGEVFTFQNRGDSLSFPPKKKGGRKERRDDWSWA